MEVDAQIVIGRLLQIAYSTDSGKTVSLLRSSGNLTLKVDSSGQAVLSGSMGAVRFNGAPALSSFGVQVGAVFVRMASAGSGRLRLSGGIRVRDHFVAVRGTVDIVKLITACSGHACEAARRLRGRSMRIENALRNAVGE